MKIIENILNFANGQWGEDRIFINAKQAGVIDGSTPIDKVEIDGYHSQAEWLAEILARDLHAYQYRSIAESCARTIDKHRNNVELNQLTKENKPCAVLAGVEEFGDHLLLTILGDCKICVQNKNGTILLFSDSRIDYFSNKTKEVKQHVIDNNLDVDQLTKDQIIKNKQSMNIKDGFWTIAFDGNFKANALSFRLNKNEVNKVLIFSDGFESIFNLSDINLESILNKEITLKEAVYHLRKIEKSMVDKIEVKQHDDASCIFIQI